MRSRLMLTLLVLALLAAPALAVESPVSIGSVATVDGVSVSVSVTPAGTIIIASPSHPMYVDRTFAVSLAGYLGRVGGEMQSLQSRTILGRDYVNLAKLPFSENGPTGQEGLAFRFDIDSDARDKVVLRIVSTVSREPLVFSADGVASLGALATKASQYVDRIKDQDSYLSTMAGRLASVEGPAK